MGILNNSNAISVDSGYDITDSLRFRASANAYLSRTPSSAGNRKTWTFSCWVKRGNLTDNRQIIGAQASGTTGVDWTSIQIEPNGRVRLLYEDLAVSSHFQVITKASLRDPSAWYHIVVQLDTTQSTATDRVKFYTNGVRQTDFEFTNSPDLNEESNFNDSVEHLIGYYKFQAQNNYSDFYLTEMHFVDGTALTASDFGESDDNGTWIPKRYTGTYGTNGFYLPMKPTTQATGFNTVLYTGNGGTQSITGVGFTPDLVWVKNRDETDRFHLLTDTIRGATKSLASNLTSAESGTTYSNGLTAFGTDGFSVGNLIDFNGSADKMVAWCWDAGGSTVTNTNGTIDSQVRANPSTGFSIATWTNESSGDDTVGHGLGVAPKLIITKLRSTSGDWYTQTTAIDGGLDYLKLNDTNAAASLPKALPTADVFTTDMGGTTTAVAYCFADVTGYQKIGSYTGNGSTTGPTVTTGFRPAFLLIKNVNDTHGWQIYDATRNVSNPRNNMLSPNVSNAEYSNSSDYKVDFNDNGFQIVTADAWLNANSQTMIYMAIADTRDEKFNFDASGNKNNWTPNNINSNASGESSYDLMSDVPTLTDEDTSNFATLNPNNMAVNTTMTDGNLKASNSVNHATMFPTNMPTTGKYYFECKMAVNATLGLGFRTDTNKVESAYSDEANKYYFYLNNSNAYRIVETTNTALGSNLNSTSSTFQVAIDFDAAKYYFGVNNTWYAADWGTDGDPASGANPSYDLTDGTKMFPFVYVAGGTWTVNFGQQPFNYTPPTGFKKINTFNLPDSTITDGSEHFDIQLWTGDNANPRSFSNTAFSPDLVWYKSINTAYYHNLYDSVRGVTRTIYPNATSAEYVNDVSGTLESFDSDGFTVGGDTDVTTVNGTGQTYVGWQWRGSDSTAVSNTDGSLTSTVSANPTAGFSVVKVTGTSTGVTTIGHGLGIVPRMILKKTTSHTTNWGVYHASVGASQVGHLNLTNAFSSSSEWGSTTPTTSVFSNYVNNGYTDIFYCFAEVEGYSKFDSYVGNGSTDGPFIYTGFRPAFIMFRSTILCNWVIVDSARSTFNVMDDSLYPNTTGTEITTITDVDFLSNGFKWRANLPNETNASGQTYIYMAFAENPFKNSNAR